MTASLHRRRPAAQSENVEGAGFVQTVGKPRTGAKDFDGSFLFRVQNSGRASDARYLVTRLL